MYLIYFGVTDSCKLHLVLVLDGSVGSGLYSNLREKNALSKGASSFSSRIIGLHFFRSVMTHYF